MELTLIRDRYTKKSTTGQLSVNGVWECFTLEDRIRPARIKIRRETCIPAGRYQVKVVWSSKRNREVPLLLDVPNFTGILIHPGNTDIDTEGCILVGQARIDDMISKSRVAYQLLFGKVQEASDAREEIWITITNTETDLEYKELSKAA